MMGKFVLARTILTYPTAAVGMEGLKTKPRVAGPALRPERDPETRPQGLVWRQIGMRGTVQSHGCIGPVRMTLRTQ